MKKRILSIVLSIVMLVSLLPNTALAMPAPEASHTHPVCGKTCSHTDNGDHSNIPWTAWSSTNSLPTSAGNYYLTANVTINNTWSPKDGTVLCLNGKTITKNNSDSYNNSHAISIGASVTFTLTDCQSAAGTITHGDKSYKGCGVELYGSAAVFNMYGGAISGNTNAYYGGGVEIESGIFNMYGGTISNNTANYGGGVYVNKNQEFNMYGGTISSNTASHNGGGGVYVSISTFNMYGGTISSNTATNTATTANVGCGGGVYISGDSGSAVVNMTGGTISGNTSANYGGGVYVYSSSTFNVSGSPVITGNTTSTDTNADNVYLKSTKRVTLTGALSAEAQIGVTLERTTGTFTANWNTYMPDVTNYEEYFSSDNSAYGIIKSGNELYLQTIVAVTGVTLNKSSTSITVGGTEQLTATVLPDNATDKTVTWSSNAQSVATVSNTGLVTAVAPGTATITATTTDGGKTATCTVTVSAPAPAHSHYNCGVESCNADHNGDATGNGHSTVDSWTAWDGTTAFPGGNVYLSNDITLEETLEISSETVNLCLNGKVLKISDSAVVQKVLEVSAGATLNICDCQTTEHKFSPNESGLWVLDEESGTKSVYGGVITGGNTTNGSAIYSSGTLRIYGGNIVGNYGSSRAVVYSFGAEFSMYGGSICGNTGDEGNVGVGLCLWNSAGKHQIRGGKIYENTAAEDDSPNGAGVHVEDGDLVLSGNVEIYGNKRGTEDDNIYMPWNLDQKHILIIDGELTNTTPIGVWARFEDVVIKADGTNVTDLTEYMENFTPDNTGRVLQLSVDKQSIKLLSPHKHCVCGGTGAAGDHTSCEDITWTEWNGTGTFPGGNVYLTDDITLTEALTISGTVNLCLNGHKVSAEGGYFDVSGTLNLCSCVAGGSIIRTSTTEALISADAGATANLYNVTLDGGAVWEGTTDTVLKRGTTNSNSDITSSAPLIYAGGQRTAGGHITLNSGVILQNNECSDAGDGGAITLGEDGTLVINGATICNNAKTDGNAGAIKAYAGAQITLNSGEIYGNEAHKHGGAVQIFGGDSNDNATAVFTMNGGTIRNNKADGVGGGIAVSDYSSFTMNGGTIKDNATTDYSKRGGGVGFADANTEMAISGNAVISGNTTGGTSANNLYIGANPCNKLSVETMGSNANVGVTMSSPGVFSSGGASYAAQFNSDNAAYKVATDGSNLKLVALHTHNYTYSATGNIITESCTCGHEETATVSGPTGTIVYDGTEKKGATVSYSTGWLGGTLTVTYQNNINAGQATASITKAGATASVKFTINKAEPDYTLPMGVTATYGDTLEDIKISDWGSGWSWKEPTTSVGDVGTKTFVAVFTPTDTNNYKSIEVDITVTVNHAEPGYNPPTAKQDLVYSGIEKELVNKGTATGGSMQYALGADGTTAPASGWSTYVPVGRDAGTYYVWYKVVGDDNYNDVAPACVAVTIAKKQIAKPAADSSTFTYNGSYQTYALNGDPAFIIDNNVQKNAGSYTVTVTLQDTANYAWADGSTDNLTFTFTIAPKAVTVTADAKTMVYGASEPALTYVANGLVAGETLNGEITRAAGNNAGTYDITQGTVTDTNNPNYTITFVGADFTITKADASCIAPVAVADLVYTGSAQTLVTAATPTGGTVQYSLSATGTFSDRIPTGTDAGTYEVYYKVIGDANHNDTAVLGPVQVTISKANQAAPVVGKVDETIFGKNDGKITGVTSAMEYRKDGTNTYTDIVGVEIAGLADGTYYVRLKGDSNHNPSSDTEVVVAAGRYLKVTFNSNGGSDINAITGLTYGTVITAPTAPTKENATFAGWFSDSACTKAWNFAKDTVTADLTLYAKWSDIPVYHISGKVLEKTGDGENDTRVVPNANVKLMLGTTVVAEQITEADGTFYFGGQIAGDYNVVVTYRAPNSEHDKVVTALVEVHGNDADGIIVTLPKDVTNSIVKHEPAADGKDSVAAGTLVGGLEDVAAAVRSENQSAQKVEVKLTVKDTPPVTGTPVAGSDAAKQQAQQKAIQQKAGGKQLVFFDLSVVKTINGGTPVAITDTGATLLEIRIPFDSGNKWGITIYRYHGDKAEALAAVREGSTTEGFWVGDDGYIHIYTHKFSTYAVGYTVPSYGYFVPVTPDAVTSADTFDAGIVVYVTMSMLAATGSAVVIGKKRKEEN